MRPTPTLLLVTLSLGLATVQAQESQVVGPRALGMGGVGVACSDDYTAQYYNPATFGFFDEHPADGGRYPSDNNDLERKDWGFGIDATASAQITPSFGNYLNNVLQADISKVRNLGQAGADNVAILEDAVRILGAVAEFNPAQDYVLIDANAGAGLRIGSFGIGARIYTSAIGRVTDLDTQHLGIDLTGFNSVAQAISNINTNLPAGYTPQTLSQAQVQQLTTTLSKKADGTAANPTDVQNAVNNIDSALTKAGISGSSVQAVVDQFGNLVTGSSTVANALLTSNTTKLRMVGLALAEIPVTYGVAMDEHWSIGGSLKYMLARVYGLQATLLNSNGKGFSSYVVNSRENYASSSNIGVDMGIMGRFPLVQVGLTGRNLNAPKFDGPTVNGVVFAPITVEPVVTAGVAFIPWTTFTIAADLDLTQSLSVDNFTEMQHAGVGMEWNVLHFLALRGGVSKNIAQASNNLLYSAGLGVNLYALRIDLAAQASSETITYDGHDYPENAAASLAVATDW